MPLVLDDQRLDLGEFPHLVAQRRGVLTGQPSSTSAAGRWLEGDDVVTLLRGQERAPVLGVAGLTAPLARRPGLGPWRLGVGMFGTRRYGGVARRLVELVLQLLDLGEERADDGLCLRRLTGDQCFRDFQRHARHVAEKPATGQAGCRKTHRGMWAVAPWSDYCCCSAVLPAALRGWAKNLPNSERLFELFKPRAQPY
jgi:hypothetical protein